MDIKGILKDVMIKQYGIQNDMQFFFAPGRVNLIGEHTDYNGGHVFPCALSMGTYCAVRVNETNKVRGYSINLEENGILETALDAVIYKKEDNWFNYVKGVIRVLQDKGYTINKGLDFVYYGDIPNGSGLSSSASLEVLTAYVIDLIFNLEIDRLELVTLCQKAENEFVGVNCGILDQFAVGFGKKNHGILLDCNRLEYKYSKIDLKDYSLIVANTNKKRALAESAYNTRRAECDMALSELKTKLNITALGEMTNEVFESHKHLVKDNVRRKRAKHAVSENQRTLLAFEALNSGELKKFGEMMNQSHLSLKEDYEVTGKELDTLVSLAWDYEHTLGARMTGAGFGGCTVNLVKTTEINGFIETVGQLYKKQIGYDADFYLVEIGSGPKEI